MDRRLEPIVRFFDRRSWEPFEYQLQTWGCYLNGDSGLIHAPTGTGKSLAAWLGPIAESIGEGSNAGGVEPIRVLWITPMRALASDTTRALAEAAADLAPSWAVEKRTGDSPASVKTRQRERLPTCLVTTPESISLLLSYGGAKRRFESLRCIVVDEWHELLSTKRGTQTELALARLRRWRPDLRVWGLSATIGNLDQAMATLLGAHGGAPRGQLIRARIDKDVSIEPSLPQSMERFPWSGHLGLLLLEQALDAIDACAGSTLVFTNTRSQAELWFRAIMRARPEWIGDVALHHGSLDRDVRAGVETLVRRGEIRCVVCTSSLDLGVDFSPVDQVIQIGSPKGVARLLQRGGRSGHRPGAPSRVLCVPTLAFELIEIAAARSAAGAGHIEPRVPLEKPLDVLAQHLVTISAGDGFEPSDLLEEVRTSRAYRNLTDREWEWCLDFVQRGGPALETYPRHSRVVPEPDGERMRIASDQIRRQHRLMIGTITSDLSMGVRYQNGAKLGSIEESFIARLKVGDRFVFAGRTLELVRVRDMTAIVKRTSRPSGNTPRWQGGRSPISSRLAQAVREKLEHAREGEYEDDEMVCVRPLLELQQALSLVPARNELLLELTRTDDGHHAFLFPFEGRSVHEGLGALIAHRLSRRSQQTLAITVNDYGLEIVANVSIPTEPEQWRALLSTEDLLEDLLACLNTTQLTRRRFRDVARIAGLIFPGYPGSGRGGRSVSARALQASSALFFDVFSEHDPQNQLLEQARREVLSNQLEISRLQGALETARSQELMIFETDTLTPFSFPIWAESLRTQHVSSESWSARIAQMSLVMEREATRRQVQRA